MSSVKSAKSSNMSPKNNNGFENAVDHVKDKFDLSRNESVAAIGSCHPDHHDLEHCSDQFKSCCKPGKKKIVDYIVETYDVKPVDAKELLKSIGQDIDQIITPRERSQIKNIASSAMERAGSVVSSNHISPKSDDSNWQLAIREVADKLDLNARDAAEALAVFWPGGSTGSFVPKLSAPQKRTIGKVASKYLEQRNQGSPQDLSEWQSAVEKVANTFDLNAKQSAEALAMFWPGGSKGSFAPKLTAEDEDEIEDIASTFMAKRSKPQPQDLSEWQDAIQEVADKLGLDAQDAAEALAVFWPGGSKGSFPVDFDMPEKKQVGRIASRHMSGSTAASRGSPLRSASRSQSPTRRSASRGQSPIRKTPPGSNLTRSNSPPRLSRQSKTKSRTADNDFDLSELRDLAREFGVSDVGSRNALVRAIKDQLSM